MVPLIELNAPSVGIFPGESHMFPLLTILVIVIIHHICTIYGFNKIGQKVFNLQQHLFNSKSTIQIQKLKSELLATRKELLQTSAQDEFAKWAKLKRKFDKLTVEYDECAKSIAGKKEVTVTFVSWGLPGLLWAFQILLLVIWRAEPVFYIPEQWFGPITNWLKFPFAPEGSVGVFYWWSALKSVLDRSTAALTYLEAKRKVKQD